MLYLHPLDFEEFLTFKGRDDLREILKNRHLSERYLEELKQLLEEFIIYGGYPEVAKENSNHEKKEILQSIFEFYLQKDIRDFANIRNIDKFMQLLKYLAISNGNLLKVNSVAGELGIHQNTTEDYISILEDTFLVKRLPPYFKNKANSLRKTKKLYFIDTGFRNYLLRYFSPFPMREDAGALLETYVFAEIYKKLGPGGLFYFFRTKQGAEIDFILENNGSLTLVEVKKKAKQRPFIFNDFPGTKEIIVNHSYRQEENFGDTMVLSSCNFFHHLDD